MSTVSQNRACGYIVKISLLLLLGLSCTSTFAADDWTYEPLSAQWNNKKVYLSPAVHSDTGARGECGGVAGWGNLDENYAALRFAYYAATGPYIGERLRFDSQYRNLRTRGYKVRIGRGTLNSAISNSNAWGADIHIPIHSNARPENCDDARVERHGTHIIFQSYGDTGGEGLAEQLLTTIGGASPGTNDLTCHNSSGCTLFTCLGELCRTVAKSAYLEREFHSWNIGTRWMEKDQFHAWRLGWAVDKFLGYPR